MAITVSKKGKGKVAYADIGVWRDKKNGRIHVADRDVPTLHMTFKDDDKHYKQWDSLLKQVGL